MNSLVEEILKTIKLNDTQILEIDARFNLFLKNPEALAKYFQICFRKFGDNEIEAELEKVEFNGGTLDGQAYCYINTLERDKKLFEGIYVFRLLDKDNVQIGNKITIQFHTIENGFSCREVIKQ
jgi:hypothetical protein